AMGVGAIATSPAQAGSLRNATIGGTAASDYLIYDANTENTYVLPTTSTNITANLKKVLGGSATSPTGNVELRASSEKAGFDFNLNTTLSGTIGGKTLTLSSLTASDWSSSYQGTTFGQFWFNEALSANKIILSSTQRGQLFNIFTNYGGFQRFSDPNISYVNQDDTTGKISIGLAGHFNATPLLLESVNAYLADPRIPLASKTVVATLKDTLAKLSIQASEIVKYSYDGGDYKYLFSFKATESGLIESKDKISHSGNYEVYIQGTPLQTSQSVPEPSIVFGILGVAGILTTQRKLKNK
ncbi:MAG: NF038130 family PEP-CTERM protein, partial [Trichormus sp.]